MDPGLPVAVVFPMEPGLPVAVVFLELSMDPGLPVAVVFLELSMDPGLPVAVGVLYDQGCPALTVFCAQPKVEQQGLLLLLASGTAVWTSW